MPDAVGGVVRSVSEAVTEHDAFVHALTAVHAEGETPFQHYLIGENPSFGRILVLDGIVQSTEADEFIYHEGIVQPAMLAVGRPRRVLVLGGGEGATAREALRWPGVEALDMVDIDEEVVAACRQHLPRHHRGSFDDPRLRLLHVDAVQFLRDAAPYDVIVSDMTDPVESGPSTFCFTDDYFRSVSDALTDDGVVSIQAGPVSPVEIEMHAKVIRTVRSVFPYVESISTDAPCYSRPLGFVLASRTPIVPRLEPELTEPLLAQLPEPMRWLTARSLRGRLDPPPYLIDAVRARDDVFTEERPPSTGHSAGGQA